MRMLLRTDDPEVPVWASYTDVAINVLVVLLFFLLTQSTLSTLTGADLIRIREEQRQLKEAVFQVLPGNLRNDVSVVSDGQLQRYRFADRVLFNSGEAKLRDEGQEILDVMGRAFLSKSGTFSRLQVEGHTDDRRISTREFPSNWELSSARATSVVRFLEDHSHLDPRLLTATGYAQYHPVDPGDSERARERNRRIEVVVVYTMLGDKDQSSK
jgi:chemotaxis protein MotB